MNMDVYPRDLPERGLLPTISIKSVCDDVAFAFDEVESEARLLENRFSKVITQLIIGDS